MSNINNSQISGRVVTPFRFKNEQNVSLTNETLSIVGTATMGPAFVPQQVVSFDNSEEILNTWQNIFGDFSSQDEDYGPISANIWLNNNGNQLTYTRVLGIGDGQGLSEDGHYNDAGFVVGDSPLSGSITPGFKGDNSYSVQGGSKGKTHFFGSYYENLDLEGYISPFSDYIEQITGDNELSKIGIVTDVVFATSGTVFNLQDNELDNLNQEKIYNDLSTNTNIQNLDFGSKVSSLKHPNIYIQGQKNSRKSIIQYPNKSNRYNKTTVHENTFNTVPDFYLYSGNLNYASFRNTDSLKESSLSSGTKHFIATGINNWNEEVDSEDSSCINYESFESIFKKAKTPWIVSQPRSRQENFRNNLDKYCKKLFRFHTYTDGKKGNKYRFRIKPRKTGKIYARSMKEKWSVFDLIVYKYNYKNNSFDNLLTFKDLNLNPKSENYIGKKVGTEYEYYDIKTKSLIHAGDYKKTNNHIYVEVHNDVEYMINDSDLIPCGFFPYPHMNISNSHLSLTENDRVIHNPIQYVSNRKINEVVENKINYDLDESYWGVLFDKISLVDIKDVIISGEEYKFKFSKFQESSSKEYNFYHNYTKYFQDFRENKFWITPLEDNNSDLHNDFFHLEKILYFPQELLFNNKWEYSFYRRDAKPVSQMTELPSQYDYVNIDKVLSSDSEADSPESVFLSFDLFSYGGFDGINILDEYKRKMLNESCLREYDGEISGKTLGQTSYAFKIAKDIALELDSFRCDIFSIPSINTPTIVSEVLDKTNDKNSFLYVFDIIDYDNNDNIIKDTYYFNNLNKNINDMLDERDSIKKDIINGTENSFDQHMLRYYNSRYSISCLNKCEASINNKNIVIPSSIVFLNSISQTNSIQDPLDSINYNNNILQITNIVNSKFIYSNNDFDSLLTKSKKKEYLINPIGIMSSNKKLKLLSSNTLNTNRKNIFSLTHNMRIYLDIKRNLKNLLFSQQITENGTILFNSNSSLNVFSDLRSVMVNILTNFFEEYLANGIIKNYFIDIDILSTEKSQKQKLENTISGVVGISFFGDNINEETFTNIKLDNLINDINDFTEETNNPIININI